MCILSLPPPPFHPIPHPQLIIGRGLPGEKLKEQLEQERNRVSWMGLGRYCPNILLLALACFWNSVRQLNFITCGLALNM